MGLDGPRARVRNAQDLLAFVDERDPGLAARLLARMPETPREALQTLPRSAWISIEQDAIFVDAFVAELGPPRAVEEWSAFTSRFVEFPLQRALVQGALRIFGLDPAGIARILPRVWEASFRECGKVVAQPAQGTSAAVTFDDLPPTMIEREGYALLMKGIGNGFLRICGAADGEVTVDMNRADRSVACKMAWSKSPKKSPGADTPGLDTA